MKPAREPASSRPKPCLSLKSSQRRLPIYRSLLALVGKKTVVRDQPCHQKPPFSHVSFSRTGVQHSPGSLAIELPSILTESGACSPDRALLGSPRQSPLPLACHHLPKGIKLELGEGAHLGNTILNRPYCRHLSSDRLNREDSQFAASLEGDPGPAPARKTLPHSYPKTRFQGKKTR